jgi:hypothetical protein
MLSEISKKIRDVASDIVTVRTGTVVTNYAGLPKSRVILDNDPSGTPVAAQGLSNTLPDGTRVMCLAYPPRGLAILGAMDYTTGNRVYGTTYTVSDTWVKPDNLLYAIIEGVSAGGGGGSAAITAAGQSACGSGAGAGAYARFLVAAKDLPAKLNVTISFGGPANGGIGGPLTLTNPATAAVFLNATGGAGGANGAAGATAAGNTGGAGGIFTVLPPVYMGGSVAFPGGGGGAGFRSGTGGAIGGMGGACYFGGGAQGVGVTAAADGVAGGVYGAGGSGAAAGPSSAVLRNGGAGAQGLCCFYAVYRD